MSANAQHLDRLRLRQLFDHFTVEDDGTTIALGSSMSLLVARRAFS